MEPALITEEHITFVSKGNTLEAVMSYADEVPMQAAILFISPHPHMGGNMNNNVIRHLSQRFSEEGYLSLRFNYHGVGKSEIDLPEDKAIYDYWESLEKEVRYDDLIPDVSAAYETVEKGKVNIIPMIMVGYSLGALMALKSISHHKPDRVVVISPPNKKRALPKAESIATPVHCFGGDRDFAFDPPSMQNWLDEVPTETSLTLFPQSDHFFRQEEEILFQHIRSVLKPLIINPEAP